MQEIVDEFGNKSKISGMDFEDDQDKGNAIIIDDFIEEESPRAMTDRFDLLNMETNRQLIPRAHDFSKQLSNPEVSIQDSLKDIN